MSLPASIAFRADASIEIGSGHVMRCLTLADRLAAAGAQCHFICRDLPGHAGPMIAARGHKLCLLPAAGPFTARPGDPVHAAWAAVPFERDAAETRAFLDRIQPGLLVLDHYAFDGRWQSAVAAPRLLVIDDLADRPHAADILLDQNAGRHQRDYDGLVPERCIRLIGPAFALLRPEFAARRGESLARRRVARWHRLLITMGGIDKDDATGALLEALAELAFPEDFAIDVVMGARAPHIDRVRQRAAQLPVPVTVHVDVADMAGLMAGADLAIGAAGGTSWERCCLGLPSLMLVLADNQARSASALAASGAAVLLGRFGDAGWRQRLAETWDALPLAEMSARAADLCDGQGALRLLQVLAADGLSVRRAALADGPAVHVWRTAGGAARYYRAGQVASLDGHMAWFARALADPARLLLMIGFGDMAIAHIRFDRTGDETADIGICVDPLWRGGHIGRAALEAAIGAARDAGIRRIHAEIHPDNQASIRAFERAGFRPVPGDGTFLRYSREVPP